MARFYEAHRASRLFRRRIWPATGLSILLFAGACSTGPAQLPEEGSTGDDLRIDEETGAVASASPAALPRPEGMNPISGYGHGEFWGAEGEPVSLDEDKAARALAHFVADVFDRHRGEDIAREFLASQTLNTEGSARERIQSHRAALAWLLQRTSGPSSAFYRRMDDAMAEKLSLPPIEGTGPVQLSSHAQLLAITGTRQQYIDACAAAGVPLPPPFKSSSWKREGILPAVFDQVNAGAGPAIVFSFQSSLPRGVCVQIARMSNAGDEAGVGPVNTLGTICQGNDTSNSCFWDFKGLAAGASPPLVEHLSPADRSAEVCTTCHQGEDAFLIHNGTALSAVANRRANGWVTPLVPPDWPQNRVPGHDLDMIEGGQFECTSCHNKSSGRRFPKFAGMQSHASFLQQSLRRTMPGKMTLMADGKTPAFPLLGQGCSPTAQTPCDPAMSLFCAPTGNGSHVCRSLYLAHVNAIQGSAVEANRGTPAPVKFAPPATGATYINNFALPGNVTQVGDVNGDGRDDIVRFTMDSSADAFTALAVGTQFAVPSLAHDFFGLPGESPLVGDVNGDGKDDLVVFTRSPASDVWVALARDERRFANSVRAHDNFGTSSDRLFLADANKDGKADIIRLVPDGGGTANAFIALSDGTGNRFNDMSGSYGTGIDLSVATVTLFGDVDGDGLLDALSFRRGSSGKVFVATGAFDNSLKPRLGAFVEFASGFASGNKVPLVGDVNGDGLDDILSVDERGTGKVDVAIYDGKRFLPSQSFHVSLVNRGTNTFHVADVDGDYREELVVVHHSRAPQGGQKDRTMVVLANECPAPNPNAPSVDFCAANPGCLCGIGEGDCDSGQCQPGLVCGVDNGPASGLPGGWDVCKQPPKSGCGTFTGYLSNQINWSLCSPECPCSLGEGDCDTDEDCRDNLVCLHDMASRFQSAADTTLDVCVEPSQKP